MQSQDPLNQPTVDEIQPRNGRVEEAVQHSRSTISSRPEESVEVEGVVRGLPRRLETLG